MNTGLAMNKELTEAFSLAGRAAVVTGAASGIGKETARVLALAGARVIVSDIDRNGLADTVTLIEAAGGVAMP